MEWLQLILTIAVGLLTYVLGYKNPISVIITEAITKAEEDYKDMEKSGKQKMAAAIKYVRNHIPFAFRAFFTDAWIEQVVQQVFDTTQEFIKLQADSIVKKFTK